MIPTFNNCVFILLFMVRKSWTFGFCESCLKNSHEKIEMVKIFLSSDFLDKKEEMWCCPVCGATKRL